MDGEKLEISFIPHRFRREEKRAHKIGREPARYAIKGWTWRGREYLVREMMLTFPWEPGTYEQITKYNHTFIGPHYYPKWRRP